MTTLKSDFLEESVTIAVASEEWFAKRDWVALGDKFRARPEVGPEMRTVTAKVSKSFLARGRCLSSRTEAIPYAGLLKSSPARNCWSNSSSAENQSTSAEPSGQPRRVQFL
jgi:hypothetical protein